MIDEIKMEEYHVELQQWEEEKVRQESEFVIYDTDEVNMMVCWLKLTTSCQVEKKSHKRLHESS